jgi:LysM repeat protein
VGKITYRPNKDNKNLGDFNLKDNDANNLVEGGFGNESTGSEAAQPDPQVEEKCIVPMRQLSNVKPIGDLDCDYHIYIEDYVYTYLYQYAQADLSTESSAVFLGEYFPESKEAVIRGIIPIPMDKLNSDSEWIDQDILKEIEKEREEYFKDQQIIGWMHMQPGYGTMLTMKELREHRRVFGEADSIFMLVDAINKIETWFVYENKELREQSGYYMYYERNEEMQRYMLEHPFVKQEAQVTEDTVVNQFREIGKLRKEQYIQRKNVNATVIIASIILISLTAIIVKMNNTENIRNVVSANTHAVENNSSSELNHTSSDEDAIKFIINKEESDNINHTQELDEIGVLKSSAITEEIKEDVVNEEINESGVQVGVQDEIDTSKKQEENKEEDLNEAETKIQFDEYVVKEGDTLANISYNKYGSANKSKEIAEINELGNTDYIRVGQTLKLPVD